MDALAKLRKREFDAVISDYQMPMMDGIEFLKNLRGEGNLVPFIIFTGKGREEIIIQALNEGADFYLQKGGDARSQFVELEHKVKQAIKRRKTEQALRESETRFRELASLLPQIVFECDRNLDFTFVNEHAFNIMGYVPDDLVRGINFDDIIHASQVQRLKENMYKLLRGYPVIHEEYSLIRKDGSTFPALLYASPIFKENRHAGFRGVIVDIGPTKRTEEYRKILVELLDSAPEAISVYDMEGNFLYVNQRAGEIHGYTREEYLAMTLQTLNVPESRELIKDRMKIVSEEGEASFEVKHFRKDGSILPLFITIKLADWGGKNVVLSIGSDITERMRMEKALGESEERYRNIIEDQTEFISRFLPDGTHIFVNEAYCNYFGYQRQDLLGHRFVPNIHPDDRKRVGDFFATLTPDHPVGTIDQRIIMPDGQTRWQQWSDRAIFGEDGTIVEYQSVGRDSTELKMAEQTIRNNEAKIRAIVDSSPIPKFVIGADHRIIIWNKALEELSGIPAEEVMHTTLHWRAFYPRERDCLADLLADNRIDAIAELYPRVHSKSKLLPEAYHSVDFFPHMGYNGRWLYFTAAVIRDADGEMIGVAETLEDITERINAEESLSQTNKRLNLLASVTRHDILNQISILLASVYLLEEDAVSDSEKTGYLNKITASANTIKRQIEFTREYQNIGITSPKWQNLDESIRDTLGHFDIPHISVNIELQDVDIYSDQLLEKVFYNIIDNSLTHGKDVTEISFTTTEDLRGLVISIADNGQGIAEDKKELIFKRGYGDHSGFGLFLVKEILDITGISISEKGEEGAGAWFEILVPPKSYRIR